MQIEPSESAFAERYGRGQAQVVWTTLVADLETPVSAFLKLGGGKPMSFLLELVEGGAVRGRYSIIGLDPDLIWRANGAQAEVNRSARAKPDAFVACAEPPLKALRELIAESRIALPDSLPPMAAGVFGYLGYDMVRQMEELPSAQSGSDRHSRRHPGAPDHHRRVRRGEGFDHRGDAGAPRERRRRQDGARARGRAAGRHRREPRPPARQIIGRIRRRPARRAAEIQHHAGRIQGNGAQGQGLHHGRRCLPDRAGAALRGAVHAAAVLALSRAAADQSVALSLLSRLRQLRRRRLQPGNSGEGCRRRW